MYYLNYYFHFSVLYGIYYCRITWSVLHNTDRDVVRCPCTAQLTPVYNHHVTALYKVSYCIINIISCVFIKVLILIVLLCDSTLPCKLYSYCNSIISGSWIPWLLKYFITLHSSLTDDSLFSAIFDLRQRISCSYCTVNFGTYVDSDCTTQLPSGSS